METYRNPYHIKAQYSRDGGIDPTIRTKSFNGDKESQTNVDSILGVTGIYVKVIHETFIARPVWEVGSWY